MPVYFQHRTRNISIPTVTSDNFFQQAASDIMTILIQPSAPLPATYQLSNHTCNGLLQLAFLVKTDQIINNELQHFQTKFDKTPINSSPHYQPLILFTHKNKIFNFFISKNNILLKTKEKHFTNISKYHQTSKQNPNTTCLSHL